MSTSVRQKDLAGLIEKISCLAEFPASPNLHYGLYAHMGVSSRMSNVRLL